MESMFSFLLVLSVLQRVSDAQCPTGCFGCSPGTTFVTCSGAGLSSFPAFPLDIQQSIEELNLRSNMLTVISATDLQNFTSLETLDLSVNDLSSIEVGTFSTTTQVTELLLNGNELSEIPDELFANTQLRTLDLADNNIQDISAASFRGLNFADVSLDNNLIVTIPNGTFSEIPLIQRISLAGNPLRCDCELSWFPGFLASLPPSTAVDAGTCDSPAAVSGSDVASLIADQFICECTPACVNGTCDLTVGACECEDGYIGTDCGTACTPGTFGPGCLQNCTCVPEQEFSPCDIVSGACNCLPGYTGSACESECSEGFFGQDCLEECLCQNGAECDFITGMCNCTIGFIGALCDMMCPTGRYGLDCVEVCICATGNCDHITGNCSCPVGFFGDACDHNCTGSPDCGSIGRETCSLETPEQTCGPCLDGHVGESGNGNTECILCAGAPDCEALNRDPCSEVENTCGPCFEGHITNGTDGFSNDLCFDPCADGIMNYNETDVDCGGPLCLPCDRGQACTSSEDCGSRAICLGVYVHPSTLDYPFNISNNETCLEETIPGTRIIQRFKDSLLGRENPLSTADPLGDLDQLEQSVEQELLIQFDVPESLASIEITDLDQEPGNPLYQTNTQQSEVLTEETVGDSFQQMIENMHSGRLKGTLLLNREERKALFNF